MYSITQDIENTEFNGWLNPEILLKNNRRQAGNRKRGYDLANINITEECEDIRRRVLRPRHDPELNNSPDASRTRPIRSNRGVRQRQIEQTNDQIINETRTETAGPSPISVTAPDITLPQSSTDLSFLQAIAAYNWSQNYLLPHTDPSFLHRIQQATYPNLNNVQHMSQRIPQFDPWVLHNYLLAASYNTASISHVSPDTTNDETGATAAAAMRMLQMAYPSLTPEMNRTNQLLWQYPFFLNQSINTLSNQSTNRPPHELHAHSTGSTHVDPNSDLSYYLRLIDYSHREALPVSQDGRLFQGLYPSDPRISNYCTSVLPNPFNYGSICPYHSSSHLLHNTNPTHGNIASSGSTPSEPVSQIQNTFTSFPHSSGVTFDQFWPQMTPNIRPLNYSLNGSNIDTLLHLAAHFEQRKRGITREELEKLPTHRYKATSDRQKQKDKNSKTPEDVLKCLVCLEDFEAKQNIRSLRCDHEFHAKCIDKWLKINRTCPLCRADAFDGSAQKDGA